MSFEVGVSEGGQHFDNHTHTRDANPSVLFVLERVPAARPVSMIYTAFAATPLYTLSLAICVSFLLPYYSVDIGTYGAVL